MQNTWLHMIETMLTRNVRTSLTSLPHPAVAGRLCIELLASQNPLDEAVGYAEHTSEVGTKRANTEKGGVRFA